MVCELTKFQNQDYQMSEVDQIKQVNTSHPDYIYTEILRENMAVDKIRGDRTGTGTLSIFGGTARFNARNTLPLLFTKRVAIRSVIAELVWFLIGSDNANLLNELKCTIWDEWKLKETHTIPTRLTVTERQALATRELNYTLEDVQRVCHGQDNRHPGGYPYGTNEWLDARKIPVWEDRPVHAAGYVGPMYGVQWNHVPAGFAQSRLEILINGLEKRPFARDHLLMAWNDDVRPIYDNPIYGTTNDEIIESNVKAGRGAIPLCHFGFQCYVHEPEVEGGKHGLSLQFHMRSADLFLGVPFNIASYGVLLHLIAKRLGYEARDVLPTFGDRHIYRNHIDAVKEQLERTITDDEVKFDLNHPDIPDILDITRLPHDPEVLNKVIDAIASCVVGYEPQAAIKAPVAK